MAYQAKNREKRDIYQEITNTIIEAMEKGELPWQKAWDGKIGAVLTAKPINGATKRPYTKENLIYLWYIAQNKGDGKDPRFYTFNQAKQLGYSIKKGAKGHVVKQGFFATKDRFGQPLPEDEQHWTYTLSTVFHASDVVQYVQVLDKDGQPVTEPVLDEKGQPKMNADGNPIVKCVFEQRPIPEYVPPTNGYTHEEVQELAENMLIRSGAVIKHDQADRAFYTPTKDEIHLPPRECFKELVDYYATALHELSHWTGHSSRLNRKMGTSFASPEYAKEELRAEMASVYLSMDLGLPVNTFSHAAYTQSWLKELKNDKMEFFKASNDAIKITNYLHNLVRERMQTKTQAEEKVQTVEPKAAMDTRESLLPAENVQITVFQLPEEKARGIRGFSFDEVGHPVRFDEYKPVYKEMQYEVKNPELLLEQLYQKLNSDKRPNAKDMQSLTMGDVVALNDQLYYVNKVGFARMEISSVKDRQYIKMLSNDEIKQIEKSQKEMVGEERYKQYQTDFRKVFHEGATTKLAECLGNPVKRYEKFIYDNALNFGLSSIRPADQKAWEKADKAFIMGQFEDALGNTAAMVTAAKIVQTHSPYAAIASTPFYAENLQKELMQTPEYKKITQDNELIACRAVSR